MTKPVIIGCSASLRNARTGKGSVSLAEEVSGLADRDELDTYLASQASIHLDQFVKAGLGEGKPFDEVYKDLRKQGGLRGLSNTEVCLAAAFWGAKENGCDIEHVSLVDHFPANGDAVNLGELKDALRRADGILLATPVYFGDRSSVAQQFIEMIRSDEQLCNDLNGKVYAGVVAGAKRNGGQETTLIYQLLDMLNLGLLGVGNDSDTTSQYGGTAHAGDVGTCPKDKYGIDTCIGTGRRIARVSTLLHNASRFELTASSTLGLWPLQDKNGEISSKIGPMLEVCARNNDVRPLDLLNTEVRPCIACSICPIDVGPDEEYRCIIKRSSDGFMRHHGDLLEPDILLPATYSPKSRDGLKSIYQQFMERTRYLRRGDYVFSDRLVAPIIVAEVGANEHLDVRMVTSFIRHHTVMHKPIVAWVHDGKVLNADDVAKDLSNAIVWGEKLLAGRLGLTKEDDISTHYQPVGYVLAAAKDKEASTMQARAEAVEARRAHLLEDSEKRISEVGQEKAST